MQPNFFEKIVHPFLPEEFFGRYHEKEVLHISRNDERYYNQILTAEELSDYLGRQDIFYPSVRIVKNGSEIPSAKYCKNQVAIGHHKKDGIIDTEKAFALFNSGSSLVIQAGQRSFGNLSACCQALSARFGSPVQANLYLTPDRSVGFNPHWDTHDVFVLQIAGTKTWKLYGFEKELPTVNQKFSSKNYEKEPLKTLQLAPGDFLYVPRGYVHDAMSDDGISAHITIGILSYTWMRFITEMLPQLEEFKEFREAVPFWEPESLPDLLKSKLASMNEKLLVANTDAVMEKLNSNLQTRQPQPLKNYFSSLLELKKDNSETQYAVNSNLFLSAEESSAKISLTFLQKTVNLPIRLKPMIDKMLEKEMFFAVDFPEFPTEDFNKVVRFLVKEGLIYIVTKK